MEIIGFFFFLFQFHICCHDVLYCRYLSCIVLTSIELLYCGTMNIMGLVS